MVSSLAFAVMHGSTDPWRFGYHAVFGFCAGLMAIISRGIEAPVAFHVADNVLATTVNTLMADGEAFPLDRSTDTGDASVLILVAVNVGMVVFVWLRERRARATGSAVAGAGHAEALDDEGQGSSRGSVAAARPPLLRRRRPPRGAAGRAVPHEEARNP